MKVLFIGLGSIGTRHYNCLKKIKDKYNLEFISFKTNMNKDNIQNHEDIKYFYNIEEALMEKPNCAIVSNPTSRHIESAIKCAQNDIHLFIEKPLSNSLENIEKLTTLVEKKKLITLMGCNLRYHPGLIELKNIIQISQFGKVYDFDIAVGSYLPQWRPWQDYSNSYSARKELGGGVVLDLIHEIDYSYWLFGEFGKFKSYVEKVSNLNIETEDIAKIIIRTKNHSLGTISLNYYRRIPQRRISVNFEEASVILDMVSNKLTIESSNTTVKAYEVDRDYTYEIQMKAFIDNIIQTKQPENSIFEGLKVLKYAINIKQGEDII